MKNLTLLLFVFLLFPIVGICQDEVKAFIQYEHIPTYNGDIVKFIQKNTNYPESAKINRIEGIVWVEFDIDTAGNTLNHRIKYGIRNDFNEEAVRVVKLLKFNQTRELNNSFNNYVVPVKFKMPKEKHKNKKV